MVSNFYYLTSWALPIILLGRYHIWSLCFHRVTLYSCFALWYRGTSVTQRVIVYLVSELILTCIAQLTSPLSPDTPPRQILSKRS